MERRPPSCEAWWFLCVIYPRRSILQIFSEKLCYNKRNNKIDRDFAPGGTIKVIRKDQAAIAKYYEELAGVKVQRNV